LAEILRGEIIWADLEPTRGREQAGHRPVMIISNELFNSNSGTVIAVAVTSKPQRAGFPLTTEVEGGVAGSPAWIKIGQIRTLSTERLGKRLARLDRTEVDRVIEGLLDIVGS